MLCKKCKFKKNIPGDAHVSCSRIKTKVSNINQHGSNSGWFMFPLNFDPIWGDKCDAFVDKSFDLDKAEDIDLIATYMLEKARWDVLDKDMISVRDENTFTDLKNKLLNHPKKIEDKKFINGMKDLILRTWEF